MTVQDQRDFEITASVNFPTVERSELEEFAAKLGSAVREIVADYPSVAAFLVAPDMSTGDIAYGLRFKGADPKYIGDMADEILDKSVELVAEREGIAPIEAEREESVLVLA